MWLPAVLPTLVPLHVEQTAHYRIESSESAQNTENAGKIAELLYTTYSNTLGPNIELQDWNKPLKMRLYQNKAEFRRTNVLVRGYAEAVYRNKTCHQYFDSNARNPYHWMLHEATHQLNHQVARLDLKLWLDEGLACYFSTNELTHKGFQLGTPDFDTYPIWWLADIQISGNWQEDIDTKRVIPIRRLIRAGAPNLGQNVNTFYLHWWSWCHFLLHGEQGKYREGFFDLVQTGGSVADFEKYIGPTESVEQQWYRYYQNWTKQGRSRQLASKSLLKHTENP